MVAMGAYRVGHSGRIYLFSSVFFNFLPSLIDLCITETAQLNADLALTSDQFELG